MPATLFVSDLHLSGERPAINERFFEFLRAHAARASALYILGDLFEYWIGDDELEAPSGDPLARRVADALAALARQGVSVAFMHGNRDFLVGPRFCKASGARLLDDPSVKDIGGMRTLLMHGDTLCTDDHDYQAWRRQARSRAWQLEFLAKSLPERRRALQALREKSKEVVGAKPADIMDVNQAAVREALRTHGLTRLVHGHTHRPARHVLEVDGRRCERWVLPDWYEIGGYLAVDDTGPRLMGL
ncbi:MAG: UDP-2,3-diacylglucosamine diphosphatase [Betaproteobacteria bacterium]|nr:UDP-2,3-diacylglucosamine diphosphatase [Betaproteobacteria bacterium]MDH5210217.1 UDP-2,3-diacylglucosamine diphosphatase [Betaproteobacteria bacterium]